MKIYNILFSPTGGTRKVTEAIARGMGAEAVTVDLCDRGFVPPMGIGEGDICIIAAPVYGGRIPALAARRIASISGNGAAAVPVAVYGNRHYDDALVELYDLALKGGFVPVAGITAVAEHNIARRVAAGRPDENDAAQLEQFGRDILSAAPWGGSPAVPGNRPYKQTKGSSAKPVVADSCVLCGMCAELCPAGAIPAQAPNSTELDKCIACQRCIAVCPFGARALDPAVAAGSAARLEAMCAQPRENELYI